MSNVPYRLLTAPTLDMAREGDLIGIGRSGTPARDARHVLYWLTVLESIALPNAMAGDRHRIIVAPASVQRDAARTITMAPGIPVALSRP